MQWIEIQQIQSQKTENKLMARLFWNEKDVFFVDFMFTIKQMVEKNHHNLQAAVVDLEEPFDSIP